MALMSMATVAVSPGKDDEMEGISKKENKRRQSRREREAGSQARGQGKAREEETEQPQGIPHERGKPGLELYSTGYREPL